jgi:Raf kinase inhibitor-like YbhB/YbcL family protein
MKCLISAVIAAGLVSGASASVAFAQAPAAINPEVAQPALARLPAKGGAQLTVTTPAFRAGEDIPFENTLYRGNIFPGLNWTSGPAGTRAYAVIMQDIDVNRPTGPLVHWTLYNIPGRMTELDPALTEPPTAASYGPNVKGAAQPYEGPRTPQGARHRYSFQIFAMDAVLPDPGNSFEALVASMKGHVLASGEVTGIGTFDPTSKPSAPRSSPAAATPASQ